MPPDVVLPPATGLDPAPPEPNRPRLQKTTCEFCGCEMGPDGSYFQMSDKAKAFRKHAETIDELNAKIAKLETDLREAHAKLTEAAPRSQSWGPY